MPLQNPQPPDTCRLWKRFPFPQLCWKTSDKCRAGWRSWGRVSDCCVGEEASPPCAHKQRRAGLLLFLFAGSKRFCIVRSCVEMLGTVLPLRFARDPSTQRLPSGLSSLPAHPSPPYWNYPETCEKSTWHSHCGKMTWWSHSPWMYLSSVPAAQWLTAHHVPFHMSFQLHHNCQLSAKRTQSTSRMNFTSCIFQHSPSEQSGRVATAKGGLRVGENGR